MKHVIAVGFAVAALCSVSVSHAEEGFFLPSELPNADRFAPGALERALRSSFRVRVGAGMTTECSAQFISNHGHILTALHCIDTSSHLWTQLGIRIHKTNSSLWIEVGNPAPQEVLLPKVSFQLADGGRYEGVARVVLLGRGFTGWFPQFDAASGWSAPRDIRQGVALHSEDFMIFQIPVSSAEKSPCVPVSDQVIAAGTDVWVVGFPTEATRPNGRGTEGRSKRVSYGRTYSSYAESPFLRGLPASVHADYDEMLLPSGRFLHSADAWVGNSGGMTINAAGELVGTIARGFQKQDEYVDVSTDSVRASTIVEVAREKLGAEAAAVFDCQSR